MDNKKILIIIPAYNEAANIRDVIVSLNEADKSWEVIATGPNVM